MSSGSPPPENPSDPVAITRLLEQWNRGDPGAAERVVPLVYDQLRAIAGGYLRRERRDHTLQTTAVVHEAWVRLIENNGIEWQNRGHFVGVIARVMRRVLVDYARRHRAAKRGGDVEKVTLAEAVEVSAGQPPDIVALDEALQALEALDPDKARIIELRFFGGLSIDEAAEHLGVSAATVNRQWRRARNWLYHRLKHGEAE